MLTRQIFYIHPRFASRDLQTSGVPPSADEFYLLRGDSRQFCTGLIFTVYIVVSGLMGNCLWSWWREGSFQ